jgi:hypothetical protein
MPHPRQRAFAMLMRTLIGTAREFLGAARVVLVLLCVLGQRAKDQERAIELSKLLS